MDCQIIKEFFVSVAFIVIFIFFAGVFCFIGFRWGRESSENSKKLI